MEFLDLYDAQETPLNKKAPRSFVHANGLWHASVHIWVINSNSKILLQKRSMEKETYPGFWDISCAGHISAKETKTQACKKEFKEELGLSANENEFQFLFSIKSEKVFDNGNFIDNEINHVFLLKKDFSIKDACLQKIEVSEIKWVDYSGFKQMVNTRDSVLVPHYDEYEKLISQYLT